MRVTKNVHEFFRTTGIIFDRKRINELGLRTDHIRATFEPDAADDLLAFCAKNPRFHIVTGLESATIYVNRYEKDGCLYKLAEGDTDPDYLLDATDTIADVMSVVLPGHKVRA